MSAAFAYWHIHVRRRDVCIVPYQLTLYGYILLPALLSSGLVRRYFDNRAIAMILGVEGSKTTLGSQPARSTCPLMA